MNATIPHALLRVRREALVATGARSSLRVAILDARHDGHTLEQIADAADLSPQRVSQIVHTTPKEPA